MCDCPSTLLDALHRYLRPVPLCLALPPALDRKPAHMMMLPVGVGMAGHIRVCYSNLTEERCKEAATRLRAGLLAIAAGKGP